MPRGRKRPRTKPDGLHATALCLAADPCALACARIITGMHVLQRNPLTWLTLLVTLLACLAVQSLGLKTASGQIYGLQSASWGATELQAAPRLGLRALVEEIVSAPPVGANGGVIQAVDGAIPNAGKAVIDPNKLTSYALNPLHPVGGDKARVFESALGYNQSNADQLIGKIQQGALTNPAVMGKADQFGQRFTVDMPITGPNGNTVVVRTGWVLDPGATIPRLATAYVK